MTSLELKSLQEREFESDKETVFASTVSSLQDLGYIIKTSDFKGGLITAESPLETSRNILLNKSSKRTGVTAFVDHFPRKTTVRLNFVTNDVSEHWFSRDSTEETVILDPNVYQDIFDKIEESVFLREGMNGTKLPSKDANQSKENSKNESESILKNKSKQSVREEGSVYRSPYRRR